MIICRVPPFLIQSKGVLFMQTRFMKTSKLGKEAVSSCTTMLVDTTHDGFYFQGLLKILACVICKWNIGFGYDTITQFPLDIERGTAGYLLISAVQAVRDCYLPFRLQEELHKQKARRKSIRINSFLRWALHCQPTKRQQWPHFPTPSRPCSPTGTCRTLIIINGDAAIATFTQISVLN